MNTSLLIKYSNLAFFVIASVLFFALFPHDKITQEVLDLFPKTKDREVIDIYREFANSHYVFVANKGFEAESKQELAAFLARVQTLPNVKTTLTHTQIPEALQEFIAKHYTIMAFPRQDMPALSPQNITQQILQGIESKTLNPYDPLNAFSMPSSTPQEFVAKDYGYVGLVELKSLENADIKTTIEGFTAIAKDFPTIRYFSQNFMDTINLELILHEVSFLLTFASVVFVVLYFVIIRIPMLTLNTIATLVFANIVAMFVVANVYPKVTIMALSFGMGISNIAIDYMMHHNFFGLYASKQRIFNRPVFYGYITTIVGFATCLFIPFPLLAQLSLYAIISLTISYCFFAFLYPRIGFNAPLFFPQIKKWQRSKIPSLVFLLLCIIGFIYAGTHLKFDFDLSKLGYENKPLLQERDFFADKYGQNKSQILLSHQNIQGLITLASKLQHHLSLQQWLSTAHQANKEPSLIPLSLLPEPQSLAYKKAFLESPIMQQNIRTLLALLPELEKSLLLRSDEKSSEALRALFDTMRNAYAIKNFEKFYASITATTLNEIGFSTIKHDDRFYYLAMITQDDIPEVQAFMKMYLEGADDLGSIEMRSLQSILDNLTDTIYVPMVIVLAIALCAMLITLAFTAKSAFLECVVFILFPLCVALCVIASHSALNIMHLFALLILVVVSVDYGIYSAKEGMNLRTSHAIFFSAITTGVSFGILMISDTKALNSFGEVIFSGMGCILLLLFLAKVQHKNSTHKRIANT